MALTPEQVDRCVAEQVKFTEPDPYNLAKSDVRAAVVAAEQWLADNAAAFNTALPQPYRGAATQAQKAALVASVATRRAGR